MHPYLNGIHHFFYGAFSESWIDRVLKNERNLPPKIHGEEISDSKESEKKKVSVFPFEKNINYSLNDNWENFD